MKKLAMLFGILAILLACVASAVVVYQYCHLQRLGEYGATSAPASVAFLYAVPFGIGIVLCAVLAVIFWKKSASCNTRK